MDEGFNATLKANDWTFEDALNNFTAVTHAALYKNNKTPFVWEEMVRNLPDIRHSPALTNQLLNFNLTDLSNDTVIDVWLSPDSAKQVADKGHKMVLASYEYFYLVS